MKLVLLEEMPGLGQLGDTIEVPNGYGRNFLLPRKLATLATQAAIKETQALKQAEIRRQARTEAEMAELAQKLQGMNLAIKAKVGAEGKLYGSVTSSHIARELKQLGYDLDKRKIEISEPIRRVGSFSVTIHLTRELTPQLTVVVAEE